MRPARYERIVSRTRFPLLMCVIVVCCELRCFGICCSPSHLQHAHHQPTQRMCVYASLCVYVCVCVCPYVYKQRDTFCWLHLQIHYKITRNQPSALHGCAVCVNVCMYGYLVSAFLVLFCFALYLLYCVVGIYIHVMVQRTERWFENMFECSGSE